jgi:hypothetical protein
MSGRDDDDAFVTGKPDGEEGENEVYEHRPHQQDDQKARRPAGAGDVLGHPGELHPTISRRCEGGVRWSPVMAAGTCQYSRCSAKAGCLPVFARP